MKLRPMRIIGLNGICVLVPCALFLAARAAASRFGWLFYGIQALELLAGSINLTLLVLNLRDGLRLARRQ
ncbi:hypothetical protein [Gluconacetobacter sacchari]|uniref:hypothetical protein n=2 Tax=Gluconacetobacter sacchari TaxID=92759 RepID=UPI00222EAF77|nr:hypothetical protein [Gluconacetobacter sacchari]